MAWDDTPPDASALAPSPAAAWDAAPPTKEELGPQWSDLPSHIVPNAKEIGKSSLATAGRIVKGVQDIPEDVIETAKQELHGGSPLDTPIAQDAKTVGKGVLDTVKALPKSLADLASKEAWVNRPVSNALTAGSVVAPFLGGGEAAELGEIPKEAPAIAPEAAAAAAKIPKDLPVMEPGLKTGQPGALFAYNQPDLSGAGGPEVSMYKIVGDHPNTGSQMTYEQLKAAGIPIIGREPRSVGKWDPIEPSPVVPIEGAKGPAGEPPSRMPPDPNAPPPKAPPKPSDPLQDVKDYLKTKQQKIEALPGWQEKAAKYVKKEVSDLRAKDIGLRDPMIRSLDPKHPLEAIEKADNLMSYASEKGYFRPGLSNVARNDLIKSEIARTGKNIGAVRSVGGQRGAPPVEEIRQAIKSQLESEYGDKASREVNTVLGDFDRMVKRDPSFEGLSNIATYLNGEKKTFNKIGQNPGPTTDAANILGRMNNEALRKVLSPEEDKFYTTNLRDFGAHKKLEQMVASSGRRAMTGRGAPGGALASIWQQLWDRGGYRAAGNVADRMSKSVMKNPGRLKTLPQFFEELAHHVNDEVDDTIQGMSKGGMVPQEVRDYVNARGC